MSTQHEIAAGVHQGLGRSAKSVLRIAWKVLFVAVIAVGGLLILDQALGEAF